MQVSSPRRQTYCSYCLDPPFLTATSNVLDSLIQHMHPALPLQWLIKNWRILLQKKLPPCSKKQYRPCRAAHSEACVKPRLYSNIICLHCVILLLEHVGSSTTRTCRSCPVHCTRRVYNACVVLNTRCKDLGACADRARLRLRTRLALIPACMQTRYCMPSFLLVLWIDHASPSRPMRVVVVETFFRAC